MSSLARPFIYLIILAFIFIQAASSPAQSGDQKAPATGSISGRVTVGAKAAAGVPVAAFAMEMIGRRRPAARAITDGEGRFRLSGLPPAQYQVTTLSPDLTTADRNQRSDFNFGFFAVSKGVTLAAGEEVEDIDLKMVRGGVITGRITDATNKPVVEEEVTLESVDENGKAISNTRQIFNYEMYQTDDRGIYRVYGLPAGWYKVSVGVEPGGGINHERVYYPRTFYPDTPDTAKANVIELKAGTEASGIDIQVGRHEETYRVSGRVVDSDTGQPVGGARVSYLVNPQNPERNSPFIGLAAGTRGEFQLSGFTPGQYGVYVSSQFDGGDHYSEITYFEVVDKDVTGIEIKAMRGLTVSGVVVTEGDAPTSFDRLRISASVMQQSPSPNNSGGVSTVGADGSFRVGGLKPGRFTLYVYPIVPAASRPSIVRVEREGGVTKELELRAGQPLTDLRVVVSFGRGAIRGTVRFVGGTLAPDSRIVIRCNLEGRRDGGGAYADARGHFLIKDLSPGTYEVTLQILRNVSSAPQSTGPPQKEFVQVTNDAESEVTFMVDLTPKVGP